MRTRGMLFSTLLALAVAAPANAQSAAALDTEEDGAVAEAAKPSLLRPITIQHFRPQDKRGINMFETPKQDHVGFHGFRLDFGAAFAQQFQGLDHSNDAAVRMDKGVDQNKLVDIGPGFNNATANLYINAQIAPGIRVAMTSYLSSRRHNETWVKDGYLLIDESPIDHPMLNGLMRYLTIKAGHFEINYGDAHFRRTDNGNAMYNPFVGNYIMDAFTTEIGGEVYFRTGPFLAMAAVTGGEIRGRVTSPDTREPAVIGKLGFDSQVSDALRVRLTGSVYNNANSPSNTLYGGDRAGSRYYWVVENTVATETGNATSGLINPGFRNEVTAFQVNPFVKYNGLELFGVIENASGRRSDEVEEREWNQYAGDVVYRFLKDERLFVGARYNVVGGKLFNIADEVSVTRSQFGGGWFITPSVMMKAEYVNQKYHDFPTTDIRSGAKFNGFMIEGVVGF